MTSRNETKNGSSDGSEYDSSAGAAYGSDPEAGGTEEAASYESPVSEEKQKDFYHRLRQRVRDWAQRRDARTHNLYALILTAPDLFHLMTRLLADSRVPISAKMTLGMVLTYFISPVDLLPEAFLGPIGYADDVALTAMVLNSLLNEVPERVIREHWAGEDDVLNVIRSITATVDQNLDRGIVRRLRAMFDSKRRAN